MGAMSADRLRVLLDSSPSPLSDVEQQKVVMLKIIARTLVEILSVLEQGHGERALR